MSWKWTVAKSGTYPTKWLAAQCSTTRRERAMAWPRKPKARYFDSWREAVNHACT